MYNTYKSINVFFCGLPILAVPFIFSINDPSGEPRYDSIAYLLIVFFMLIIFQMRTAKEVKISNDELLYKDSLSSTYIKYVRSECNFDLVKRSRWESKHVTYDLLITCNNKPVKHSLYCMSQFKVIKIGKELGIDVPFRFFR